MAINLDKSTLRELILDFYTMYDPQRLRDGIDVSGMVDWTFGNGLDSLNQMLNQQYGAVIDPRKKVNNNSMDAMNRISTALMGPIDLQAEEMKRQKIVDLLTTFYRKNDPSKLDGLDKLVDFAMYRGVDILNEKLYMKYGEDLSSVRADGPPPQLPPKQTPMKPPAPTNFGNFSGGTKLPVAPPKQELRGPPSLPNPPPPPTFRDSGNGMNAMNFPPPPPVSVAQSEDDDESFMPPPPPMEDFVDPNEIQGELERFYRYHDPAKLDVVEGLSLWVMKIGRIEFNKKLIQLYGSNLDDPLPEKKSLGKHETILIPEPPSPPPRQKSNSSPKSMDQPIQNYNDNENFDDDNFSEAGSEHDSMNFEQHSPVHNRFPTGPAPPPPKKDAFAPPPPMRMPSQPLPPVPMKMDSQRSMPVFSPPPMQPKISPPPPMVLPRSPSKPTNDFAMLSSNNFKMNTDKKNEASDFSMLSSNAFKKNPGPPMTLDPAKNLANSFQPPAIPKFEPRKDFVTTGLPAPIRMPEKTFNAPPMPEKTFNAPPMPEKTFNAPPMPEKTFNPPPMMSIGLPPPGQHAKIGTSSNYGSQPFERPSPNPYSRGPAPMMPNNSSRGQFGSFDAMGNDFDSGRSMPVVPRQPSILQDPRQSGSIATEALAQATKMRQNKVDKTQVSRRNDTSMAKATDFNADTCDNFRLDMNANAFGTCVCGKVRAAHNVSAPLMQLPVKKPASVNKVSYAGKPGQLKAPKPKVSGSNLTQRASFEAFESSAFAPPPVKKRANPIKVSTPAPTAGNFILSSRGNDEDEDDGGNGKPCNNYRLDMTGATFGVCKCGFARAEHSRK